MIKAKDKITCGIWNKPPLPLISDIYERKQQKKVLGNRRVIAEEVRRSEYPWHQSFGFS